MMIDDNIIEISDSEEEEVATIHRPLPVSSRWTSSLSAIPFTAPRASVTGSYYSGHERGVNLKSSEIQQQQQQKGFSHLCHKPGTLERTRRIVHRRSSSSDVIELTDSSDNDHSDGNGNGRKPPIPPVFDTRRDQPKGDNEEEEEEEEEGGSGVIVLGNDETKTARKRHPQIPSSSPSRLGQSRSDAGTSDGLSTGEKATEDLVQAFSTLSTLTMPTTDSDVDPGPTGFRPPVVMTVVVTTPTRTPRLPSKVKPATIGARTKGRTKCTPAKTPRKTSGKAFALAEQAERATYAQSLFDELNRTIFAGHLPVETSLVWSKRLLTTAGRARWHRSKEGVQTTSIELATKILDSNERIRNTLSHEMCHLACWVINKDPKEGHGKIWKSWAAKVMRKRTDIDISTRHNYEISYPFEWECGNCAKTYGRFSKSIHPERVVCGACKTGMLHPLFTVRSRMATTPSKSGRRTIATSPRDPVCATPIHKRKIPGSFELAGDDDDGDDDDDDQLDGLVFDIHKLGLEGDDKD